MLLMGGVILLSGIAIGAGGAMLWLGSGQAAASGDDQTAAAITAKVDEICRLTDDQADQVKDVIARRLALLDDIREEMAEEVLMQHQALRDEMARILSPKQLDRWTRHMDRLRDRSPFLRGAARRDAAEARRPPGAGPGVGMGPGKGAGGRTGLGPRNPARMFRMLDSNNDDALNPDEVPPRLWSRILEADTNGDDAVTFEELSAAVQTRPAPPPPRPAPARR
jgi:flagellar basal body-associated protein FliL